MSFVFFLFEKRTNQPHWSIGTFLVEFEIDLMSSEDSFPNSLRLHVIHDK